MANNNRLNAAKNLRKKSNAILELKKKTPKKTLSAIAKREKKNSLYCKSNNKEGKIRNEYSDKSFS